MFPDIKKTQKWHNSRRFSNLRLSQNEKLPARQTIHLVPLIYFFNRKLHYLLKSGQNKEILKCLNAFPTRLFALILSA